MVNLPIIDISHSPRSETVAALRSACEHVGFFYLKGHGVPTQVFQAALVESKRLFDLPSSVKRQLKDTVMSRGYTEMEEETLDPAQQTKGDTKEGYYIGRHIPLSDPRYNPAKLTGPNQWPDGSHMEDAERFKTTMENYFDTMCSTGFQVVQLLAEAIGLERTSFDSAFQEPMAALRLLHYSTEVSRPDDGIYGCGAHSDYGMVTLLYTIEPGLQILTKQNEWLDVPPLPDALIVNLGDMLERWTNGIFCSTKHRVLTSGERYSIPFFYEPNFDTVVECLPVCCSEENPPKYPPTTSGQHLLEKYKATHAEFNPDETI